MLFLYAKKIILTKINNKIKIMFHYVIQIMQEVLMKKRISLVVSCSHIIIFMFIFVLSVPGYAQKKTVYAKNLKKSDKELKDVVYKSSEKYMIGATGGYFLPVGDLGDMVDGNGSGKVFGQYRGIWKSWLGLGADIGFRSLNDNACDGSLKFLTCMVNSLFSYDLPYEFEIQGVAGLGVTGVFASNVSDKSSADFTVNTGFNAMKHFLNIFAAGLEFRYYYMLEEEGDHFLEFNMFAAVKF